MYQGGEADLRKRKGSAASKKDKEAEEEVFSNKSAKSARSNRTETRSNGSYKSGGAPAPEA